jgi:acyl-CoA synthetase (AMP-forming)/AMP-acid ligase II
MSGRLLDGLERRLAQRPDAAALLFYPTARAYETLSWRDLDAQTAGRAAYLRERAQPGALVLIVDHDPLGQVLWWLAALRADAVPGILTPPTPKLDPVRYRRELDLLLATYPDALVLYGERVFAEAPPGGRFVALAAVAPDAGPQGPSRGGDPAGAAIFQQSSGTTGLRKAVVLSERAVVNQLDAYAHALAVSDDDRILCWLPLYHDMGLIGSLALAMHAGLTLVLASPFVWLRAPDWWVRAAHEHRATLSWLPNFAFNLMVDRVNPARMPEGALASLRAVIDCSEPVSPRSLQTFAAHFAALGLAPNALSSCYAMAENTFAVTQTPPGRTVAIDVVDGRSYAGSGRVIEGTELRIIAEDGRTCGDREAGEIAIHSTCLMSGYEGAGAESAGFDAEGWFHTGDVGYMVAGELFVIGRKKDIIIRAGRNLDPSIFEAAVSAVPGVKPGRVVAIGVANEREGTDDLVIIAERAGDGTGDDEIRTGILGACETEAGTVPQKIALVDAGWLAKSSSGKISRAACRTKYLAT